jgi:hypothetical protein
MGYLPYDVRRETTVVNHRISTENIGIRGYGVQQTDVVKILLGERDSYALNSFVAEMRGRTYGEQVVI